MTKQEKQRILKIIDWLISKLVENRKPYAAELVRQARNLIVYWKWGMIMSKEFIINCIEQARGDDLYRAEQSFLGLTVDEMAEEYGESGRTRRQILDDYQSHYDKCDAAIALCREKL